MDFNELEGLVIEGIEGAEYGSDKVTIQASGRKFTLSHIQDCCEQVRLDSILGDISALVGEKIINAVEHTNRDNPKSEYDESFLWTYYTIRTQSATVVFRWYGTSNGYYSESVDFEEIMK